VNDVMHRVMVTRVVMANAMMRRCLCLADNDEEGYHCDSRDQKVTHAIPLGSIDGVAPDIG